MSHSALINLLYPLYFLYQGPYAPEKKSIFTSALTLFMKNGIWKFKAVFSFWAALGPNSRRQIVFKFTLLTQWICKFKAVFPLRQLWRRIPKDKSLFPNWPEKTKQSEVENIWTKYPSQVSGEPERRCETSSNLWNGCLVTSVFFFLFFFFCFFFAQERDIMRNATGPKSGQKICGNLWLERSTPIGYLFTFFFIWCN